MVGLIAGVSNDEFLVSRHVTAAVADLSSS